MVVAVVAHNPDWAEAFDREASAIRAAAGGLDIALHHIGSTAVPGILAKPIIDMMGTVPGLDDIDDQTSALEAIGYEAMGSYGIEGRRYFRKMGTDGRRTHHLHVFAEGSPHAERHLAFRDYLIAHPETAAAYSELKAELASRKDASWDHYIDGKDPFIGAVENDAIAWCRQRKRS